MRSLKAGAILLSVWAGLNLFVGAAVTALTLLGHAPPALALMLTKPEIAALDARAVAVVNAQAMAVNPCIVVLCTLVLVIVWRSLVRGEAWALGTLAATLGPLQFFGFVSDSYIGHRDLAANLISTAILGGGLILAALGLWTIRRETPARTAS
jgi:hypothetical protein